MCDFADKCKFVCIVSAKKEGGPVMAGWLPSKRPHNHRLLPVSTNPTGKCWLLSGYLEAERRALSGHSGELHICLCVGLPGPKHHHETGRLTG